MSWSELQRLVEEAETDGVLRRGLRHCRSRRELLLACRRLGYAIDSADLHQARALESHGQAGPEPRPPQRPMGSASGASAAGDQAPGGSLAGAALPPTVRLPLAC